MMNFNDSENVSLGVELELQIINKDDYDLVGVAENILQELDFHPYKSKVKPEITQSMLEINSGIHPNPRTLLTELRAIRNYLSGQITNLNVQLSSGGTHPFQLWNERKIYPTRRFESAATKYGYLAKMFTVFGMHVHVGCRNGEEALYLTHALTNYVPQFIALSASSPFCQGIDTEFDSSRSTVVNGFPLSGVLPLSVVSWDDFVNYIKSMRELKIIENVDNFYWDIRPRPEYGTVEIRVCDAPLSVERVAMVAAYVQTVCKYLMAERPVKNGVEDKYHLNKYNKFQASKFGFDGDNINPQTLKHQKISDAILTTCKLIDAHSSELGNDDFIAGIMDMTKRKQNDAQWLRELSKSGLSLPEIVHRQSLLWSGSTVSEESFAEAAT